MVKLNNKNTQHSFLLSKKPTISVSEIHFITDDKNWPDRLATARLTFVIAGLDNNGKELKSHAEHIILGELITPQHTQPVFLVDIQIKFNDWLKFVPDEKCDIWKAFVELYDIALKKNEQLNIIMEVKES